MRYSLNYVAWKDKAAFANDLKALYQAPRREAAEAKLLRFREKWNKHYAIAVRSWETNWEEFATMFDYPSDIRRLIYTINNVESYNGQLRRVTKTKGAFPSAEAVRKLLFLATRNITRKWTMPVQHWASVFNQSAIRFEGRFPA